MTKIDVDNIWSTLVKKDGHRIKPGLEQVFEHETKCSLQQLRTHKWDGKLVDWKISLEKRIEPLVEKDFAFFVAFDAMNFAIDILEK